MKVFVLFRTYEDQEGYDHNGFIGVFATRDGAEAALLESWRQTELLELGKSHLVSNNPETQEAIERTRAAFNEQVLTGTPPPEAFTLDEQELGA